MPVPPWKGEGPRWFFANFFHYFRDAAGIEGTGYLFPFLYIAGAVGLARRQAWVRLGALVTPLLIVLFASGFELYPFQGRMVLFTVPFSLVMSAEGVALLLALIPQAVLRYVFVGLLLLPPTFYSVPDLLRPRKIEEVRPIAQYIQREAKPDDFVVIFKDNSTYLYYAACLNLPQTQVPLNPSDYALNLKDLTPSHNDYAAILPRIAHLLQTGHHGWLFISHAKDEQESEVLSRLPAVCRVRLVKQEPGAQLFALEPL
jgi:hypothetical protein